MSSMNRNNIPRFGNESKKKE